MLPVQYPEVSAIGTADQTKYYRETDVMTVLAAKDVVCVHYIGVRGTFVVYNVQRLRRWTPRAMQECTTRLEGYTYLRGNRWQCW